MRKVIIGILTGVFMIVGAVVCFPPSHHKHPPGMHLFNLCKTATKMSAQTCPKGIWLSTVLDPEWWGPGNEPPHRLFIEVDLSGAAGECQGCDAHWESMENSKLTPHESQVSEVDFNTDESRELLKKGKSFWYSSDHTMDGQKITFKWLVTGADFDELLRKTEIRFYSLRRK